MVKASQVEISTATFVARTSMDQFLTKCIWTAKRIRKKWRWEKSMVNKKWNRKFCSSQHCPKLKEKHCISFMQNLNILVDCLTTASVFSCTLNFLTKKDFITGKIPCSSCVFTIIILGQVMASHCYVLALWLTQCVENKGISKIMYFFLMGFSFCSRIIFMHYLPCDTYFGIIAQVSVIT